MATLTRAEVALPFLDDRHVALADGLRSWCEANAPLLADPSETGVDERATAIARRLGADGWLAFLDDRDARWDFRSICLAREILAHAHDLADFAFSIQTLAAMPLARHGSPEQQDRYLPGLAQGQLVGSFAISELEAGSDLTALALDAHVSSDGWVLNGTKAWIANATTAGLHTVIARTGAGPGLLGLSAFLVPASTPGVTVGEQVSIIAPRPFGHLRFDDCHLPADSILGRPGHGFAIAMELLEHFRMTVGAAAVGFARRAANAALGHARTRRIANGVLFDLDTVRASFADMETQLSASWLLVLQAAWETDTGRRRFARHSSMAKLHATESAQHIVDASLQMFGAAGLVSHSITEQLYRQVRLLRIYEGTSEVQRTTIARGLDFHGLTSAGTTGGSR